MAIADNSVARNFLERGYTYFQFLSGYLLPSPIADLNIDFSATGLIEIAYDWEDMSRARIKDTQGNQSYLSDEIQRFYKQSFISIYLETTSLQILAPEIMRQIRNGEDSPYPLFSPERFLSTLNEIERVASMPEATFSIIHLMKPHLPVLFDSQGKIVAENWTPSPEQYFDEFRYTNSMFIQMVDTILNESNSQPIIIFQADHGSTFGNVWSEDERLTHFDVYAAYFLPDRWSISFPEQFTLINTFPLLLNTVFGTEFQMMSNQLIEVPRGYKDPFEQVDVTDDFGRRR